MSSPAERLADLAELNGMVKYAVDLREAARKNRERGGLEEFPQEPKTAQAETVVAPKPSFEIPTVSEGLYNKTREALAKEGFTHVVTIEPISMGQLATDETTNSRFGYVTPSEKMRAIAPQQMEVAFDPKNVKIKDSNYKPTDEQKRMTREDEAKLKGKLPEDVRGLVSMPMHDPSTLSQADFDYQDKTGKPLYPDFFVRTDTETVPGGVAGVGRDAPSHRLGCDDWDRDGGDGWIFAARGAVLPRKLAEAVE